MTITEANAPFSKGMKVIITKKGQNGIENKESMNGIFLVEMPMEYFLEDEEV